MLTLRALNPQTDQLLFRQAYDWRSKPRKQRLSFEDFAADDPSQITLGLFNGELIAVYFFHQLSEKEFGAHFTSSRKADKGLVLAGARQLVEWFKGQGLEIVAHVSQKNTPLQEFALASGLRSKKALHSDTDRDTMHPNHNTFVEFRS